MQRVELMSKRAKMAFVTTLTIGRAPLVLLFMVGALWHWHTPSPILFWSSFLVLVGAAATDLLDGYFARKFDVTSRFGALADPLTDKIFYLVSLPTLLFLICMDKAEPSGYQLNALLMLFFTVLFILRDQWVTFLRAIGSEYKADVRANWSGKARTALSFPIVCVVYFKVGSGGLLDVILPMPVIYTLYMAGITINIISIVVYTRQYMPYVRRSLESSSS